MKFHLLNVTAVSATFELDNSSSFFAPKPFDVLLNDALIRQGEKQNVFTLFSLEPAHRYIISIEGESLRFSTKGVSAILRLSEVKGSSSDTARIQAAIASLPQGGLLIFEKGIYHATVLYLRSHLTIEFEEGAILYGDPDPKNYPLLPGEIPSFSGQGKKELMTWEGAPKEGMPSLITGFSVCDVAIVGNGIIDAQADISPFWQNVKTLTYARPRIVFLNDCEEISLIGLTIRNSPSWTIHPYFSRNLTFCNLKVENPKDAPNTDGINPECCSDVLIAGVLFSVGDDCIAVKSGKLYIGQTFKTPSSRITIRNCRMEEGHGAIVLGSEAGAGIRELKVERCLFENTDRGLRIKSRRGRGKDSVLDGITFSDIKMKGVLTPLVINMFYFCDPDGKEAWVQDKRPATVDDSTPYLGSFAFERFDCEDCEWAFGYFYGLPERPIGSITIKDSRFTVKKEASRGCPAMMCGSEECSRRGFLFTNVAKVRLENIEAEGYEGDLATLTNVASYRKI